MFTINQPLIKSPSQTYEIRNFTCDFSKGIITVETALLDNTGNQIETIIDTYEGQDAEAYWSDFVSKQFMYEQFIDRHDIDTELHLIEDVVSS